MALVDFVLLVPLILVGGIFPLYLGLSITSTLKNLVETWKNFFKGVSIGFLFFIFYDLLVESSTLGIAIRSTLTQTILVTSFSFGFLSLVALQTIFRKKDSTSHSISMLLAYLWSLGLAYHSLAEGIVVGVDFFEEGLILAPSQVVSFGLHKAFEGFTVAVFLALNRKLRLRDVGLTGAVAGFPLIVGSLLGSLENAGSLASYFFALGAGASMFSLLKLASFGNEQKKDLLLPFGTLLGVILWYLAGLLHEI